MGKIVFYDTFNHAAIGALFPSAPHCLDRDSLVFQMKDADPGTRV
jgi:hypothetical protein